MLRRIVCTVLMVATTCGCGSGDDGSASDGSVTPTTKPKAAWFMVVDATMRDGWDFRIIVRLADRGVDVDQDRCGETTPPGTANQFATISIENQSDRDAPLPEVTVSLDVDGETIGARWKPGPRDNCGTTPWGTTYGDYSDSIRAGDTKTNSGAFAGIPDAVAADAQMTVFVNEANVIGGGGQEFTDTVPASELGGGR